MVIEYFFPRYLVIVSWRWPFLFVRKGHCVKEPQ